MSIYKCPECNKVYQNNIQYFYGYCKSCNSGHFRDNFPNWTSGDDNINKLIQESQLNAENEGQLLEWIEYSNLKDIEHLAEGGFGSIYKAIWKDGRISYKWNVKKSEWERQGETKVAIKKYRNVTIVSSDFLNEVIKLE